MTQLTEAPRGGTGAHRPEDLGEVMEAVQRLTPAISARAPEIEQARRVPLDLVDDLIAAGCFRMMHPGSHGGLDATFTEALDVLIALARADGSVGWTVMIGAGSWCDIANLPRATFDEIFGPDRDTITAGAFNPSGSIVPTDGGYEVRGRWAFASGCQHATCFFGNCLAGFTNGAPDLRVAVFRPEQVTIEDTWWVSGLCGTGSHHIRVDDLVVDEDWTFVPLSGKPCVESPFLRVPLPSLYALAISGVAVGIAEGALAEVLDLAAGKVPMLASATLSTSPTFHLDLAGAEAGVRAAKAQLYEVAEQLWAMATGGWEMPLEDQARARATAVWVTEQAAEATRTAYRAGGGSSLYLECPLQRRLRDVDALSQHFLVKRDTLRTAGAVLAGQPVDVPVF